MIQHRPGVVIVLYTGLVIELYGTYRRHPVGVIFYSRIMNPEWMREKLAAFDNLALRYDQSRQGRLVGDDALNQQLHRAEPTIKEILTCLDPALAEELRIDQVAGALMARRTVQRALGILEDRDEWAANLAPDAPTLPADRLHPWVWAAARTLWDSKHYRNAVDAAANAINAHTQTKIGRRDISDNDLMNHAFTEKLKPGQAYLQLPGDLTDQTVKSRNRALRPFAEGCFAGIRNPAAHEHGPDWDQQKALEYLAALSVLARWIDECVVNHAT